MCPASGACVVGIQVMFAVAVVEVGLYWVAPLKWRKISSVKHLTFSARETGRHWSSDSIFNSLNFCNTVESGPTTSLPCRRIS